MFAQLLVGPSKDAASRKYFWTTVEPSAPPASEHEATHSICHVTLCYLLLFNLLGVSVSQQARKLPEVSGVPAGLHFLHLQHPMGPQWGAVVGVWDCTLALLQVFIGMARKMDFKKIRVEGDGRLSACSSWRKRSLANGAVSRHTALSNGF